MKEPSSITLISTRLSSLGFFYVVAACLVIGNLAWAQTTETSPSSTNKTDAAKQEEFELPEFMKDGLAKTKAAEKIAASRPAAFDSEAPVVAPNEGEFVNKMTVVDIIVSPRQKLLRQPLADIRMEEVPIRDALRYLAEAAGINYILPALETDSVTVNMHMPPFKAMEVLANNFGLGIYEEDGLWFIRKKDKAQYFAKIYKLQNINLGQSSSGAGTTSTTSSDTTTSSTTSSTTSTTAAATPTVSSGGGDTSGSTVMTTLQEILGINVNFGGTMSADGSIKMSDGAMVESKTDSSSSNSSNTTDAAENTYVSYDADANTLFIIATATQHDWVKQYLEAIDNPQNNIAIEAMFLESSRSPTEIFGTDWNQANALVITPDKGVPTEGTVSRVAKLPFGGLMSATNLSWGLKAFETQTNSQIARYPSVVTQNGRQVQIKTTQNIPLVQQQNLVNSAIQQTGAVVSTSSAGTQEIGTTISITPRQINDKLVNLDISIEISSKVGSQANALGQFPSNNSTYTGTVNVPEGYTLAIGGLERIEDDLSSSNIPGLGKIPLFGFLFKQKDTTGSTRTNIFLFITPTILKTDRADGMFMKPTENLAKDWIEKASDQHRAWRRNVIDPEEKQYIKDTGKN